MNLPFTITKKQIFLENMRELFFPQGCVLCGKNHDISILPAKQNENSFFGLCKLCLKLLHSPITERSRCSCCGQPLVSEKEICIPCRTGPERFFDKIITFFPYQGKYKKLLSAYKFEKRISLGNYFADLLTAGLDTLFAAENESEIIKAPGGVCLVPVPVRPGKIKKNGWDQIECLTGLMEKGTIPVYRCLRRLPSKSQKSLNREERLKNLKGRIKVRKYFTNHEILKKKRQYFLTICIQPAPPWTPARKR